MFSPKLPHVLAQIMRLFHEAVILRKVELAQASRRVEKR
jgi:hypothetical protein